MTKPGSALRTLLARTPSATYRTAASIEQCPAAPPATPTAAKQITLWMLPHADCDMVPVRGGGNRFCWNALLAWVHSGCMPQHRIAGGKRFSACQTIDTLERGGGAPVADFPPVLSSRMRGIPSRRALSAHVTTICRRMPPPWSRAWAGIRDGGGISGDSHRMPNASMDRSGRWALPVGNCCLP